MLAPAPDPPDPPPAPAEPQQPSAVQVATQPDGLQPTQDPPAPTAQSAPSADQQPLQPAGLQPNRNGAKLTLEAAAEPEQNSAASALDPSEGLNGKIEGHVEAAAAGASGQQADASMTDVEAAPAAQSNGEASAVVAPQPEVRCSA